MDEKGRERLTRIEMKKKQRESSLKGSSSMAGWQVLPIFIGV